MYKARGNPLQWILLPYEKKDDFNPFILKGQGSLKYPNGDDVFTVDFAISGLNYQHGLAQELAMIVLFLHILIALFTLRGRWCEASRPLVATLR